MTKGVKMNEEDLYYKGVAKSCMNCFYRVKCVFKISRCNLHPNITTADALNYCGYKDWQPNQKLHDKKG